MTRACYGKQQLNGLTSLRHFYVAVAVAVVVRVVVVALVVRLCAAGAKYLTALSTDKQKAPKTFAAAAAEAAKTAPT